MKLHVNYLCPFLLLAFVAMGCRNNTTRHFEWSQDIAALTGKDLGRWLRQAPFSNELIQESKQKTVLTNAQQVFPFMGRFNDAAEELRYRPKDRNNPIFKQETVLYKDPDWGDLFVNATLLYEAREVYLNSYYSESGNILLDGAGASMYSHGANLKETDIFARTPEYKTGLYWARTQGNSYLLGFFQKDHLIFEAAVPLHASDTLATLTKLNAVNKALGLDISEWEQATLQQLEPRTTEETFWKDPFVGLYFEEEWLLDRVLLKMKDTPFQEVQPAEKGDHYFQYTGREGKVSLFTRVKPTQSSQAEFDAVNQDLPWYETYGQKLYYQEQEVDAQIMGTARAYFKSGAYLEIHYAFPQSDAEAKTIIHAILQHVQVRRHL